MILFQFVLIIGVLALVVLSIGFMPGDRSRAVKRLLAIFFAVCAVLAILFPDALTATAHFLGVGRGADLLLYLSVLAMLFFMVATLRSKARSDARVTELARAVALMEARMQEPDAEQAAPKPS